MGKNVNVVKNLFILQKNMLQLHTQNSVVPKEESNVNQVAARARESLDIQKKKDTYHQESINKFLTNLA